MRTLLMTAAFLALAACQKDEPPPAQAFSSAAPSPLPSVTDAATPARPRAAPVVGWTTSGGDFLLLGRTAPAFSIPNAGGGKEANNESLRNHWTILAFRNSNGVSVNDKVFVDALVSAAGQDPDLDVINIVTPMNAEAIKPDLHSGKMSELWVDANAKAAAAFGVDMFPTYLLIGPDLTIEAYRRALAATPDNGIKDVIRGYAEIRKQVSAPQ